MFSVHALVDSEYLERACALAALGVGHVSPNPPVGAVLVGASGQIIGEGYHRRRGEAHAESNALADAERRGHRDDIRGATMYVTLEPCNHFGRTPPCSETLVAAGVARVVIGAADPNPRTALGGVARLRAAGIAVALVDYPNALALIRRFAVAVRLQRPYLTVKMAASLDGYIAPEPGRFRVTGREAERAVHDLRFEHDAVMVGAATLSIDDPQLTVRPPREKRREAFRIVVCGAVAPSDTMRVFSPIGGVRTLLLIPGAYRERYAGLESVTECVYIGDASATRVDLPIAMGELYRREIAAVLCEGGPTLAASLLDAKLVDRLEWFVAPRVFANGRAQAALHAQAGLADAELRFTQVERVGDDIRLVIDLPSDVAVR